MRNNLNILMAAMGMEIGGAETHVLELSRELKKCGFNIIVVSNGGVYEKELKESGIKHIKLPLHNKKLSNMIKSYRGLRRIIKEEKIDIVHSHARIPSFLCGILHKRMKFPFITTAHWVFKAGGIWRILTNWGQKTIAVSNDIKKYLIDNYSVNENDITVTINGIDLDKFSSDTDASDIEKEFDLKSDRRRIVYVSRMDTDRSLVAHHLIEITPKLDKNIDRLEVVIVGGGNDFNKIKSEAEKVNSTIGREVIKLTGARVDINKFVKTAEIFVGVSRAALEAMAAAKPVIVAGNEGYIGIFEESKLEESIKTNFTCRDCRQPSKELLYDDVIRLMKDMNDDKRAQLGAYSRDIIASNYSVSRMALDARQAYKALLREKKIINDVIISGYYGFKNNGDDALLSAIVDDLRSQTDDVKICVLSHRPKETASIYGVEAVNRLNIIKIHKKMNGAKLLISGGGSLIQDGTSTQSLLYYLYIMKIAKKHNMSSMLYANGIGPIVHQKNKVRAAKVLKGLDIITLRDPDSLEELEKIGIDRNRAILTADPAFSIRPAHDSEIEDVFNKYGIDCKKKLVGISVRQWKMHGADFEKCIADAADYMSRSLGYTPVFINMQYPVDVKVSRAIMGKMSENACIIDDNITDTQMLAAISKMSMVIGERLHTLIYAAAMGVPFVGIGYDPKIKSFMDYAGQKNYINIDEMSFEKLKEKIDFCNQNRETVLSELEGRVAQMQELAKKNSRLAMEIIQKR